MVGHCDHQSQHNDLSGGSGSEALDRTPRIPLGDLNADSDLGMSSLDSKLPDLPELLDRAVLIEKCHVAMQLLVLVQPVVPLKRIESAYPAFT